MTTHPDAIRALLARPSVEGLIYALRHPEVWPEGFVWDYSDCTTCALGLTYRLWISSDDEADIPWIGKAARWGEKHFGMPPEIAEHVFLDLADTRCGEPDAVQQRKFLAITPEHVAAALERWLERRG
jgi:hypothetical protein